MRAVQSIRLVGLALALAIASGPASFAEQHEPLARFWLDQATPQRSTVRPGRSQVRRSSPPRRAYGDPAARESAYAFPASAAPKAAPVQNAKFVIGVFGDDLAVDVVRGLSSQFSSDGDVAVVDESDGDQSMTGDAAAWAARIAAAQASAKRLDAAVLILGGSDSEAVPDSAQPADLGPRIEAIAAAFKDKHVPLFWMGVPPVHDTAASQGNLARNAVIREHAAKAGATFIDTWEAFTDENGQFAPYGPDVEGQRAKLRRSDGIRFTIAGARKLASFAETDIRRLRTGAEAGAKLASIPIDDPAVFDQALQVDVNAQIRREAGLEAPLPPPVAKPGPVISLVAAPTSVGGRLSTDETPLVFAETNPVPHPGRIDDFSWPRP